MERRTIIAFIIALLVIIYYPHYLRRLSPPSEVKQQTEERQISPVIEREIISPEPAREKKREREAKERFIVISTPILEAVFSNHEGTIKSLKLFEYPDKDGNPVELLRPVPAPQRPIATTLPQTTIVYSYAKYGNTVVFTNKSGNLTTTKTYTVSPDSYIINADISLENTGKKEIFIPSYTLCAGAIFPGDETQANMYLGATSLIDGKAVKTKFGKPGFRTAYSGKVFWSGLKNKYFAVILKPQTPPDTVTISDYSVDDIRGVLSYVTMPQLVIPAGSSVSETVTIYAGPKKYDILKSLGMDLDKIMDLGMLAPISKLLLHTLNFFYRVVRNYGFAIILLTLLVRIILYPLTLKSYKSMREMHRVQPLVQELQKKYKEDPKRMQKEMMLLYKEHKVNPFGGCFPMLLQMPILIALFTTLRSAIELRGAPFIFWIKDLSEPDALISFQRGSLNILPIFLIVTMFFQQKMTKMPATTEQQAQQQKIMGMVMPIFMGFIFYNMPSGLVLYFGLSTLFGVLDQRRVEKAKTA